MKRLLKSLCLALLGIVLIATPVLAIADPDDISIFSERVFQNVFESGDMLFVVYYNVEYAAPPTDTPSSAFFFNLYGTDGTTLLYSRGINYYQENIQAIYLDAATAVGLTWGSAYVIKVTGNPAKFASLVEGTNVITLPLAGSDWITGTLEGTTPDFLQTYLAGVMNSIDAAGIDVATGGKLNTLGRTYFTAAIPGLDSVIPDLFVTVSYDIQVTHDTPTAALETELSMANKLGAALAASFTGIGAYFGVSQSIAGGMFLMGICLLVMFMVYKATSNITASMVLAVPFLIIGAWSGLIPLSFLFVLALLIVGYILYHLWLTAV